MTRNVPEPTTQALGPRLGITRACSSSLAAAVAVALVGTSLPVVAAEAPAAPLTLLRAAAPQDTAAPASVLGLDSDDGKAGRTLTIALRKAFANRGLSGGEEISLEEMRLTMGCDNDSASCLAEGGQTLGVRRLVFGYLRSVGKGKYQLDIQILDTEASSLEAQASIDLTKGQLSPDDVDATAVEIVNELMPAESSDSDLPPRTTPMPEIDEEDEEDEPIVEPEPRESRLKFGLEKPTPRWKWVGFGTSLGMTVLAGGATIGMGVWLTLPQGRGGFRDKLLETAAASLTDDEPGNDIDPNSPTETDLCAIANEPVEGVNAQGQMTVGTINEDVFKVCRNGEGVRTAQIVTGIGTAVFGLSTLVFTGVLLVHRRKPGVDAMMRHRVRLGMSPNLDGSGGLSIAGGMRF